MSIEIPEQYQGSKNLTIVTYVNKNYSYIGFSGHRNSSPKSSLAKLLDKLDRDLFGNKEIVVSFRNVNDSFIGKAMITTLELGEGELADRDSIKDAIINSLT